MFRITREVGPFMWILPQVVEFFAVVSVTDVAPVTIDGGILPGMHVGQVDRAVPGLTGIFQRGSEGFAFQVLARLRQFAHLDQGGEHVNQAHRHVGPCSFFYSGSGPDEGHV